LIAETRLISTGKRGKSAEEKVTSSDTEERIEWEFQKERRAKAEPIQRNLQTIQSKRNE
jgi:hypothetical protein